MHHRVYFSIYITVNNLLFVCVCRLSFSPAVCSTPRLALWLSKTVVDTGRSGINCCLIIEILQKCFWLESATKLRCFIVISDFGWRCRNIHLWNETGLRITFGMTATVWPTFFIPLTHSLSLSVSLTVFGLFSVRQLPNIMARNELFVILYGQTQWFYIYILFDTSTHNKYTSFNNVENCLIHLRNNEYSYRDMYSIYPSHFVLLLLFALNSTEWYAVRYTHCMP